jgi:hypothetical protein
MSSRFFLTKVYQYPQRNTYHATNCGIGEVIIEGEMTTHYARDNLFASVDILKDHDQHLPGTVVSVCSRYQRPTFVVMLACGVYDGTTVPRGVWVKSVVILTTVALGGTTTCAITVDFSIQPTHTSLLRVSVHVVFLKCDRKLTEEAGMEYRVTRVSITAVRVG